MSKNSNPVQAIRQTSKYTIFALLIVADGGFAIAHLINKILAKPNRLLDLSFDGGYAELFQYVKEFWVAIALYVMFRRTSQLVYLAWSVLFVYIFFDDMLSIHESFGLWISAELGFFPVIGLRARDLGEIAVYGISAIFLITPIIYFHRYSSPQTRQISYNTAAMFGIFIFFGAIADLLHTMSSSLEVPGGTLFEEGGEMISMSLLASYLIVLLGERLHLATKLH